MIKVNTVYSIDNGANSVIFTEGKKGSITGTHQDGTLTGFLENNTLKGTFHNTKVNATGLIEITFHENGFDAKWKNGMEPGPMRGKWKGCLEKVSSTTFINFQIIQENGQEVKETFNHDFSNLGISSNESFKLNDYHDLIMNPNFCSHCKTVIEENKDYDYFINNSNDFSIQITKVNNFALSFLWGFNNENLLNNESFKLFFDLTDNNKNDAIDILNEFKQDYILSLNYIINF